MDRIDELLARVEGLPPAPQILPRLLRALADPDTDINQIVEMVAIDPALTAKLLQTCNSAFFGAATPANDIAEAVNRVGFRTIYRVAAAVSGSRYLAAAQTSGLDGSKLWRHSVETAFAAQFIGEDVQADTALLFTAGLLHDIGKIVLAMLFKDDYARLLAAVPAGREALAQQEKAAYGVDHAEVGARMMERWKFSAPLSASVQFHHRPSEAGEAQRLAACVDMADVVAHGLSQGGEASDTLESDRALNILGLPPASLASYRDRIQENMQFVEAMCRLRT